MSPTQRASAAATAVLSLAIVAVLVLRAAGVPIAQGEPEPTSTPVATATASPAATPSPGDVDVAALFREIEQQVIEIRGLPAADIGPAEVISREELMIELTELFEADYPPEEREADNITLRAFGLLTPDQDIFELQLRLLGDQVLGFYDDQAKRMVVVSDVGVNAEAKLTYAHEYVHALQDAAFGLDSLDRDVVGEDDRGLAQTALIEGDATLAMLLWAFAHLTPDELAEIGQTPIPDTGDVPSWMIAVLSFPYDAGALWTQQLYAQEGGFAAIDAAFRDPPGSTSQIIHFDKWLARQQPVPVEVPDLAAALGDGWREVDATPMGEASIGIMLEHFGVPPAGASSAATGWAGDRYVVAAGPDDEFALAWRLAWETQTDAAEFSAAYATVIDALPFPAELVTLSPTEVLIVHASSDELLATTLGIAGD